DVYPLTQEYPVRIEVFDIEVDSIRAFDADTQRSLNCLDNIIIPPATEAILPTENWQAATERLKVAYEQTNAKLEDEEEKDALAKNLMPAIEALENGDWHESYSYYNSFLFEASQTIIDYIPESAVIVY